MPSAQGKRVDDFYHSLEWRRAREMKIKLAHGLCEKCGRKGTEIHHIVPLTEKNIDDASIRIGMGNLMLLCKSCHDSMRSQERGEGRCAFDRDGNVISIRDQMPSTPPGGVPKKK